jgi:hypothetical protein
LSSGNLWADNITASGSIAGALSSAIEANNLGIYNVVSYGADPTGSSSSTTAINDAINAASSATIPGGIIYFPPGTYLVVGDLNPGSSMILFGPNATLKAGATGAGSSIISSDATLSNLTIYGLTLDLDVEDHPGAEVTAIALDGASSAAITLERMTFINGGGGAAGSLVTIGTVQAGTDFSSYHCERVRVINCNFVSLPTSGKEMIDIISCNNSTISGCIFANCSGNASLGIYGYNDGVTVSSCIFDDNPAGEFLIVEGQNIMVTGCVIKNSTAVTNASSQLINLQNVKIGGNIFNGNSDITCWWQFDDSGTWEEGEYDVQFENSANVMFESNIFSSYDAGIVLAVNTGAGYNTAPTDIVIRENVFAAVTSPISYANVSSSSYASFGFNESWSFNPVGYLSSSALSGTVTNPYPFTCQASVSGGTGVTNITLTMNGATHATGLTSGTFILPPGAQISASYTSAPTIVWFGL